MAGHEWRAGGYARFLKRQLSLPVSMMSQWWVSRSSMDFGVAEHLRPIGECQIGGDQQRGVFVEFADQVEQQLAARLAERQIAEFIDDDEIVAQQLLGQPATTTGGLLLLQLIDEIDQIEEASSGAGANDRRGHCDA